MEHFCTSAPETDYEMCYSGVIVCWCDVACWESGRVRTEGAGGVLVRGMGCGSDQMLGYTGHIFFTVVSTFIIALPKFPDVSLLNPILAQFSLSRTLSPTSASSIISGICTAGC
jgi:hypothetical protein